MKQRTRSMHGGDDLISYNMIKKTDGDLNGEIPLHKMRPQEHFIEAQIQEGDTLQAIALRFYCSVSELKRINHIHKDNEIFARRTVKIPVTPYSVLTEVIPTSQADSVPSTSTIASEPTNSSLLLNTSVNRVDNIQPLLNNNAKSNDDYSIDCNAVVLNSTLAPSVVPFKDDPIEPMSEDTHLLPPKLKDPVESIVVKQLTSQGADFGLKWFHLFCLILILCVVIPIIYVIFYVDKPPHEHPPLDLPPLHTT